MNCPNCRSENTHKVVSKLYEALNFFKCEDCSTIWTDKDDLPEHRTFLDGYDDLVEAQIDDYQDSLEN